MSSHFVFSVFDNKAAAFLPPFLMPTVGMAHRAISDCVNDPSHSFGAHPEDYFLFKLAEFDDVKGTYSNFDVPESWPCVTFVSIERDFVGNGSLSSSAEPPHILPETGPTDVLDEYDG